MKLLNQGFMGPTVEGAAPTTDMFLFSVVSGFLTSVNRREQLPKTAPTAQESHSRNCADGTRRCWASIVRISAKRLRLREAEVSYVADCTTKLRSSDCLT